MMIRFTSPLRRAGGAILLAALLLPAAACSDSDPLGIDPSVFVGTYNLTALRFDPQGSLPDVDILATLVNANPQLVLTADMAAQVVFRDPVSELFVTIQGTFRTTTEGARIEFASNAPYAQLFLSRRMEFVQSAPGVLTFDGEAPDGVNRARLQALVPDFQNEQLLDPTPGHLRMTFTRP